MWRRETGRQDDKGRGDDVWPGEVVRKGGIEGEEEGRRNKNRKAGTEDV